MVWTVPFFDLVALPYELLTRHPVWERHCAWMATRLPRDARHVLDLGCGPGNSTAHLRDAVGAGAVGGDYALGMLRRAHRRDPALRLVCLDAAALPLPDGSLDGVTLHSVLYLLPDRAGALREAARVLRPGGRIVLLEPHGGWRTTLRGLGRALPNPQWTLIAALWRTMSGAYGRFSPAGLRALLEGAGLRVLELEEALGGLGLTAVAEKPA